MLDAVDLYHLQRSQIAEIIDREHSEIRQKQADLQIAIIEGMGMDLIVACAQNLIETTLNHFKSEESAMEASKFVGLGVHQLFHAEMIKSVQTIWSDLDHRKIGDAMQLMVFFDGRLARHLDHEDGAFGSELRLRD
jgi:hemerythrin-like metal-binding protein